MIKTVISLTLMAITTAAFSQRVKNEVEKRINKEEMPAEALQTLEKMPVNLNKTKFYLEKDNDHTSYEAKVKFHKEKYSIEFEQTGALHDIEIVVDMKELPQNVAKTIKKHLKNTYKRYKIEKIQQNFSPANSENAFDGKRNPDKYELIVATKNEENKLEKMEIRFDATGNQLETRKVLRRAYEFLLF